MKKKISRQSMNELKCNMCDHVQEHSTSSAIYGLGFLGALFYYVTTAPTIWAAVIGVIKAMVWPAFLVYSAMKYLGM